MRWIYDDQGGEVPVPDPRGITRDDAAALMGWFDTTFYALDKLRTGELALDGSRDPETLRSLRIALADIAQFLEPRISGLVDALVRAHYEAGGSHAELATSMKVPRATAQYRGSRVRFALPRVWELWARGEAAENGDHVTAIDVLAGDVLITSGGQHGQVSDVSRSQDGSLIYIQAGPIKNGVLTFRPNDQVTVIRKKSIDEEVNEMDGNETCKGCFGEGTSLGCLICGTYSRQEDDE